MNPAIPKDGAKKIRKFIETVESLKSGKDTYFSITRLTSIKSLCKDALTAAPFVFFLAERTMEKAESKPCPSHIIPDDWEKLKDLMAEAVHAMRIHLEQPTAETLSVLLKLLSRIESIQTTSVRRVWGREIRTILSGDLLMIENALQCILHPNAASELAYRAARDYTEKYNAHHGTGLIPESVPMLEDIIQFWTGHGFALQEELSHVDTSAKVRKLRKPRCPARKARETETLQISNVTGIGSFENRYPNIAGWAQDGWIEIGYSEGTSSFIRVLDHGGMVWEGKTKCADLAEALGDAEKGIQTWLGENDGR